MLRDRRGRIRREAAALQSISLLVISFKGRAPPRLMQSGALKSYLLRRGRERTGDIARGTLHNEGESLLRANRDQILGEVVAVLGGDLELHLHAIPDFRRGGISGADQERARRNRRRPDRLQTEQRRGVDRALRIAEDIATVLILLQAHIPVILRVDDDEGRLELLRHFDLLDGATDDVDLVPAGRRAQEARVEAGRLRNQAVEVFTGAIARE